MYLLLNRPENTTMWQCDRCKCKTISHSGFVTPNDWSNAKICFTCHWFEDTRAVANRGASFVCSECTTIPCETHASAVARSFALSCLQKLRRERFIPPNVAVTREEHEFAQSVERNKLEEFKACRCALVSEASMEQEGDVNMIYNNNEEPTMVQRSVVAFPVIKDAGITARVSANKRSATVTPSPEESRGRCAGCHVPIEFGKSLCAPCFLQTPDGRAKRARLSTSNDTEMCLD